MTKGIYTYTDDKRERKGLRIHYVQEPTKVWINWLKENLTDKFENTPDIYRRGVGHDARMIDGFKAAIREMIRLDEIEIQHVKVGKGESAHSVRYAIRRPQPKPEPDPIPEVKQRFPNGLPAMDHADGETYRGALWRKLDGIEHKVDQLTEAVNALLLAVK